VASGDPPGDDPVALPVEEVVRVGARDVRPAGQQLGERSRAQVAMHGRHEEARRAPSHLAVRAADEIVGERLDLGAPLDPPGHGARVLATRHGVEQPEAPAPARLPGELRGAENRGGRGSVDVIALRVALRRPPDAPRVEDERLRAVEAPEAVRPAPPEVAEDARALDEERPLLLEEGLERRQVHHGGIDLDLPEVGLMVPSSVRLLLSPYFTSRPAPAKSPRCRR
jgi:hypothetical protein